MTIDINTLKGQTNDGQILYGGSLAAIVERSVYNPDKVIYNANMTSKGELQTYKDNGGYELTDLNNDASTDKIDTSNILSSKVDYAKNSDGADVWTFYKYNGDVYSSIIVDKLDKQSGINKDLVISSIVKGEESDSYTIYNIINYNDKNIGTMTVYKNPTITHLKSTDVISTVNKDETSDSLDKYNVLKYDQTQALTIESNKVYDGNVGEYNKIKNVLGKDVVITGLTNENFDPYNIYIPTTFEYGKASDIKEYIGYYVADSADKDSANMLLMLTSSKDNSVEIYDIVSSYNVGYIQSTRMSNFIHIKNQDGKDYKFLFAIRPNEINVSAGGFFYFDLILNSQSDNQNKQGQYFKAGKDTIGKLYRSKISDLKSSFNPFKLFDLNYEPYKRRKINYSDEFIGHEIVMMKDTSNSENIVERPVHLIIKFKLTKNTDASKDMIEITSEVYDIFSTSEEDKKSYTLDDKGVVVEMNRYH